MTYSCTRLCKVFVLIGMCITSSRGLNSKSLQKQLFSFDDVWSHLRSGYRVSYFIKSPDCDPEATSRNYHEPFGNSIDFFFSYEDYRGMHATQFTSKQFLRQSKNSTAGDYDTLILLRQGVIDSNDMSVWNITVASPTGNNGPKILDSWTFSCYFGNKTGDQPNQLLFYANDEKLIQLNTLEDVSFGLMSGEQLRYSTWFIECQGDIMQWLAIGGIINDFEVIKVNNVTVIQLTNVASIKGDNNTLVNIIVTSSITKLFGDYTNFIVTFNLYDNAKELYQGSEKCNFQSEGGVVYYHSEHTYKK